MSTAKTDKKKVEDVPPVQTKKLIVTYESGDAYRTQTSGGGGDDDDDDGARSPNPEMSFKELAQPGTTKKRMKELEKRIQESELELQEGKYVANVKVLSDEQYGEFANDRVAKGKEKQKEGQGGGGGKGGSSGNGVTDKNGSEQGDDLEEELWESNWKETSKDAKDTSKDAKDTSKDAKDTGKDAKDTGKDAKRVMIVVAAAPLGKNMSAVDSALVDQAVEVLQKAKNEVIVLDLSRVKSVDCKVERDKVSKADLIIFHYRSVLHCPPSRLLEWFQNVFVEKAAYSSNKFFDDGPLKGKKSFLLVTLAQDKSAFNKGTPHGEISQYLWPIENGILRFVGLTVLSPLVIYGAAPGAPVKVANEGVSQLVAKLAKVWEEKPM